MKTLTANSVVKAQSWVNFIVTSRIKCFLTVLAAFAFACFLSGCAEKSTEQTRVSPDEIRAAISGIAQGWRQGTLPEIYWPEPIKTLKPIRVYSDRVNCVIALSVKNGIESGYYVYVTTSSYLPSNDQKWSYTKIGENIWAYTKKITALQDGGKVTVHSQELVENPNGIIGTTGALFGELVSVEILREKSLDNLKMPQVHFGRIIAVNEGFNH